MEQCFFLKHRISFYNIDVNQENPLKPYSLNFNTIFMTFILT